MRRNVCKLDQRPRDKTEELVDAIVLRSITGNKAMARLIDLNSAVQITSNEAMARLIDMISAVPRLTPALQRFALLYFELRTVSKQVSKT